MLILSFVFLQPFHFIFTDFPTHFRNMLIVLCQSFRSKANQFCCRQYSSRQFHHVASSISNGKTGCAPVTIKNGEQPNLFLTVTRSAHKIKRKNQNHFVGLPTVTL